VKPAGGAGGVAAAALIGGGVWQGARWLGDDTRQTPVASQRVPDAAEAEVPSDVVTV